MSCRRSAILYRPTYHIEFTCCPQHNAFSAKPKSQSNFSSCPRSFSASGSFPISLLFTSGGQSIGASALPSVLAMKPTPGLLKLMFIELVMPFNHLILCCPLLLLPSIFPSIRVFSSESALHSRWPKYWNFSFNISPSNEHPGLISFRMD